LYLLDKGLKIPLFVVNFKNYLAAQGERALALAMIAERISRKKGVAIAVAPPVAALFYVAKNVDIPVFAQHSDAIQAEASTGQLPINMLRANKVKGSLLNHSERRLSFEQIAESVKMLRDNGLISIICARDADEAKMLASLSPDIIAVEPPELIGSGRAVSRVAPNVVSGSVRAVKDVDSKIAVLCGAGISQAEDVRAAMMLGADGVLVASAIVMSKEQERIIEDMSSYLTGARAF